MCAAVVGGSITATTAPQGRSKGAHGNRVRYEMMMAVKDAFTATIFDNKRLYVKLSSKLTLNSYLIVRV
ncbi:MAG: hypothetical protein VX795_02375 [Actinomycetota bacterium]|uniref:Uncharacterized protein n=1 Tax=marine metagenome TaxID=408172 RepID=A0A381PAG5_9ZZZZ|nr:hypothetical protein [Actinomycetota bacterium]|tara:strand:+ start:822 stop:1028 length:207 start_codon:yes stop_codon:yes gene_type:complete